MCRRTAVSCKEPGNSIIFLSGGDGAGKAESKEQFLKKIPGFPLSKGNRALLVVGRFCPA